MWPKEDVGKRQGRALKCHLVQYDMASKKKQINVDFSVSSKVVIIDFPKGGSCYVGLEKLCKIVKKCGGKHRERSCSKCARKAFRPVVPT